MNKAADIPSLTGPGTSKIPTMAGAPTAEVKKANPWDSKPEVQQPKQNLWDDKPPIAQPKSNIWEDKPMDFKGPGGGAGSLGISTIPSLNAAPINKPAENKAFDFTVRIY